MNNTVEAEQRLIAAKAAVEQAQNEQLGLLKESNNFHKKLKDLEAQKANGKDVDVRIELAETCAKILSTQLNESVKLLEERNAELEAAMKVLSQAGESSSDTCGFTFHLVPFVSLHCVLTRLCFAQSCCKKGPERMHDQN